MSRWMLTSFLPLFPHLANSFVHDVVLPHHTPVDCTCAPWTANTTAARFFSIADGGAAAASSSCAMPSLALTPDLQLPVYSPQDGWCLCDAATTADAEQWCVASTVLSHIWID